MLNRFTLDAQDAYISSDYTTTMTQFVKLAEQRCAGAQLDST